MTTKGHPGDQARHSDALKLGARVGLVAYGVVHVLIAWIALRIAWSGSGNASSGGALKTLAGRPLGQAALWITAIGLAALMLWQLAIALWGHRSQDRGKRLRRRLSSGGRVIVYAVLGWSAAKVAAGSGTSAGNDSQEQGLTARLMSVPAGRLLVAAIGVGILAVAVRHVQRGLTDDFTHDLTADATSGRSGWFVLGAGRLGYVAKGIAIGAVGVLFGWASVSYDPDKAGGLDRALKTVRDQPFGPALLTLIALGLAAFGLFCFAWARYARTR